MSAPIKLSVLFSLEKHLMGLMFLPLCAEIPNSAGGFRIPNQRVNLIALLLVD
jgi:hypothetical protein